MSLTGFPLPLRPPLPGPAVRSLEASSTSFTLGRSLRIMPLPRSNNSRSSCQAVGIVASSSPIVRKSEPNIDQEETGTETQWLYELKISQALPIINMSRTPASILLPATTYQWFERTIHRHTTLLLTIFRVSLVSFAGLLVVPTAIIKPWIPLIFVISTLPPVLFASFYSLEVLALLPRYYDFWFISMLNTLTWFGLGVIFGDLRALTCLTLWFNFQTVVASDANFRTFPAAVKSTVISGPAMVALVACCAYSLVVDSNFPTLYIGAMPFQSRQVVVFTASTISFFMFKKAYTKRRRMRIRERDRKNNPGLTPGRHTIPCVLILARVRLGLQRTTDTQRNTSVLVEATATRTDLLNSANLSRVQQLQLAPTKALVVDARKTLLRGKFADKFSSVHVAALYCVGAVGITSTAISWSVILLLYQREWTGEFKTGVAVLAALSSFVFVSVCVSLAQRDLLRLLVWNFDVLFSTFQGTALALCLLDLLQWQAPSTLAVIAWWLWFHFLLVLDAVTPTFSRQVNIRKHFGLPAVILVLAVAAGCALELIIRNRDVFKSRLLWRLRVVNNTGFDVFTSMLAVQRTVTILGWFSRLMVELVVESPDQLLFIRRQVEYFSPYVTFSEPASIVSTVTTTSVRERRRSML